MKWRNEKKKESHNIVSYNFGLLRLDQDYFV